MKNPDKEPLYWAYAPIFFEAHDAWRQKVRVFVKGQDAFAEPVMFIDIDNATRDEVFVAGPALFELAKLRYAEEEGETHG